MAGCIWWVAGRCSPTLPILAQTLLGRPRVVLGRIQGVVGLPQATGNPFFVNALGASRPCPAT